MEEVDTITVAVSGIDINKVEPLDTRRLVTFINHYLATTVSFLNHFATQCESKLDRMQQQLHRVECRLKLLECKLASIPGLPSTPTAEAAAAAQAAGGKTGQSSTSTGIQTEGPAVKSTTTCTSPVPGPSSSSSNASSVPVPPTAPSGSILEEESNHKEGESGGNDEEDLEGTTSGKAKDDPRYAKYFKMVTVGVPVQAVKLKMMSEGIDPNVLDQ